MHSTLKYLGTFAAFTLFATGASVRSARDIHVMTPSVAIADDEGSPIYGVTIPAGYRQWEFVAPSHEAGDLDKLRAFSETISR